MTQLLLSSVAVPGISPIPRERREKMGRMRITFLLPTVNMSGGIRVAAIYAEKLQQRGHHVVVVSSVWRNPTLRERVSALLFRGKWLRSPQRLPSHLDTSSVDHRIMSRPGPITAADVPDADVVVATWWETVQWAYDMPACKGAKIHFMQDYEIWGGPPEMVTSVHRLPVQRIVLTEWMSDLLRQEYHQEPLAKIPNSVDLKNFSAPVRGKQQTPTIGLVYVDKHYKGTDVCLRAIDIARQQIPNLRVVSMGNETPSAKLPLPDGTEFTFRARDQKLKEIYSSCDAWLFGTRVEGFGLPILEAMACRTPVIGTPAGAAPELLSQGGGFLVPMEDAQAMAESIVKICRMNDPEWRALSNRAFNTVTGYTWDDATDRFEEALRKVAVSM